MGDLVQTQPKLTCQTKLIVFYFVNILRHTHTWRGVGFLAAITSCACVVDATLTPDSSSLMLIRSLLQVAHQGFADDVLQAQVIGGVTKGMIPGVDAAYRPETNQSL